MSREPGTKVGAGEEPVLISDRKASFEAFDFACIIRSSKGRKRISTY